MELSSAELSMLKQGLNALTAGDEQKIEEIKERDDEHYKNRMFLNKFLEKPLTVEDRKQLDIEKERKSIREVEALQHKLFHSSNHLLVISGRIQLCLTRKD